MQGPYGAGGTIRVAAVISQHAGGYHVRWEPGGVEEDGVRLGPNARLADRGSLRHDFLVGPAAVRASFATDPAGIVRRELREKGRRLTAAQIRENLIGYGLGADVVAAAWPAVAKALLTDEGVRSFGEKTKRTYLWIGPATVPVPRAAPAAPAAPQPDPSPAEPLDAAGVVAQAAERVLAGTRPAVDLTAAAGRAAELPLTGRVPLILAVDRMFPGQVADDKWWHGATLAELAAAATGPLGVVTGRPAVVDRVIQPLINRELAAATSLSDLGEVLALAPALVRRLDAATVAAAFHRVTGGA